MNHCWDGIKLLNYYSLPKVEKILVDNLKFTAKINVYEWIQSKDYDSDIQCFRLFNFRLFRKHSDLNRHYQFRSGCMQFLTLNLWNSKILNFWIQILSPSVSSRVDAISAFASESVNIVYKKQLWIPKIYLKKIFVVKFGFATVTQWAEPVFNFLAKAPIVTIRN